MLVPRPADSLPPQQLSLLFRDKDTGSERLGNSLTVSQPGRQFEPAYALWPPTPPPGWPTEARPAGVDQRQVGSPDPGGQNLEKVLDCRYTVTF